MPRIIGALALCTMVSAVVVPVPGEIRNVPSRLDFRRCFPVVATTPAADGPDVILLSALEALRAGELERARKLHAEAADAYDAAGGASSKQLELLALVGSRVDQALVPGFGRTTPPRPPPPTREELEARTRAKQEGDRVLMKSVETFANKTDAARFEKSYRLIDEARACFRRAGSDIERERDGMMGSRVERHSNARPRRS